jgi:hypothetical protein
MHDKFLIRGLPVIVSDSALTFNSTQSLPTFLNHVAVNMSAMIREEACNLETNLMMSSVATVGKAFTILEKTIEKSDVVEPWFISFRNCKFKAVSWRFAARKLFYFKLNFAVKNFETFDA